MEWHGAAQFVLDLVHQFVERGVVRHRGVEVAGRQFGYPTRTSAQRCMPMFTLRFQCLNGRQPLCNGREEALDFFQQVRDRLAIAREMPQQASLEESIKQRIEGAPGNDRLSATK